MAGTAIAAVAGAEETPSPTDDRISRTEEAIHQEVDFKASRRRVYEVLTDATQFDRVVRFSGAMRGGMPPGSTPTEINREVGGPFSLVGGVIVGRPVELVRNERIVQAWRPVDWTPGIFSIARIQLVDRSPGTKLIFDHTGFPRGAAQHLADGWHENYWTPMASVLGG